MATRDDDGRREPLGNREGPYEYPALEPETGYRAGRWLEFKRLFARSWNNGYTKETVILCGIAWAVMAFGMTFLGWR